jgi:hypothetical protein
MAQRPRGRIPRILVYSVVLLLLPLARVSGDPPSELDSLIDMARGAPPEFAADALIRIAGLAKLEKTRRIELLEEAFRIAAGAQEPFKRRAAALDGDSGQFLNHAFEQNLDGLSLRLRAVDALLPLDAKEARSLFSLLPPLEIPAVSCEDSLVYDSGLFYEVMGRVAAQSFTPKEIATGEAFQFLMRYLSSLSSPVQVAPAARTLAEMRLDDTQFQALAALFADALRNVSGDDRSFTQSQTAGDEILGLAQAIETHKASPLALLEAYRAYLVNHLSGSRCADSDPAQNVRTPGGISQGGGPRGSAMIAFFNDRLRMDPLQPIQREEATPSELSGKATTGARTCQDRECRAISEQYLALVIAPNDVGYTDAQKNSAEWKSKLADMLSALDAWRQSSGVTASEYFHEKSRAYSILLQAVPNGAEREIVLRAMLDYLSESRSQVERSLEWFLPVNGLIGQVALDPLGLGSVANELRRANDPVISLYANLEKLAPRSPDRIMALL